MNRTRLTEQFEVACGPGDPVTVLSAFRHPTRGPVNCPAAPLLACWLRARGQDCRIDAADHLPAGRGGLLVATTYLDLDGRAVGLAVAAPAHAAAPAAEAVRIWSAALRTRRLIVCASAPGCDQGPAVPGQPGERGAGTERPGCPRAAATLAAVRQYQARGDAVVAVGQAAGGPALARLPRVGDAESARTFQPPDPERLSFVQHPCAAPEEVARILRVLRARFPLLRGQHPDQWCYRSADRRQAVAAVAGAGDLLLVSTGSTEARWLAADTRVPFDGLHVLRPERLAAAATVGVLAPLRTGPADRGDATDEVAAVLGGLGPLSVAHHTVLTRVATDVLAGVRDPAAYDQPWPDSS